MIVLKNQTNKGLQGSGVAAFITIASLPQSQKLAPDFNVAPISPKISQINEINIAKIEYSYDKSINGFIGQKQQQTQTQITQTYSQNQVDHLEMLKFRTFVQQCW